MRKPFEPGNSGGAGRPIGARNKLQTSLLKALCEDFEKHGIEAVRIARVERPIDYLKVCVAVPPKEIVVEQGILADLSDRTALQPLAVNRMPQPRRPSMAVPL